MTIQPDYVKEELLHELSESFRMHNQLPPDLFTRYRIKRGLRNADVPVFWSAHRIWATYTAIF